MYRLLESGFVVSVSPAVITSKGEHVLRIQIQMRSINLIESPQEILCRAVDVVASRIVRKVLLQRRLRQLRSEEVDFVEEKDD